MKSVKVEYTVQESFVETNKKNIAVVMNDLRKIGHPGVKYCTFLQDDGQTFVHFGMYSDADALKTVTTLPSFNQFRMELKASNPLSPPKSQDLSLVGTMYDIFE